MGKELGHGSHYLPLGIVRYVFLPSNPEHGEQVEDGDPEVDGVVTNSEYNLE